MSSPATPDFKQALKGFWSRPEGKTGMVFLLATVVAGLYSLSLLLPWAIAFATDLLHLAILGIGLFATLYIVTNKTFRNIISNAFQSIMRKLTSVLVEIDPIGILENGRDKAQDILAKLTKAVGGANGAKQAVQGQINRNNAAIRQATAIKEEAEKELASTHDAFQQQRLQLAKQKELLEIGRKIHSNEKLQTILTQTSKMYDMMQRWRNLGEFQVENLNSEIDNAKAERQTILAAYKGMSLAKQLIHGEPEELRLMNQSLEYLARDNADKLGEMEDFANYSEKYLTQMDLENAASASDAEKMLAQFEQKLLGAGGQQTPLTDKMIETTTTNYLK